MQKDKIKIVFLGSLVPDQLEYVNPAFSRAGNDAQWGFLEALAHTDVEIDNIISFIPSPTSSLRYWRYISKEYIKETKLSLIGYINFPIIKYISLLLSILNELIIVSIKKRPHSIISYNFSVFSAIPILIVCKMFSIVPIFILYDIDIPGQTVKNSLYQRLNYNFFKLMGKNIKNAIVINKNIIDDYSIGENTLVIEGGILSKKIRNSMGVREFNANDQLVILYAGALESYNGVMELISSFKNSQIPNSILYIAGSGILEEKVREEAEKCESIEYLGYISGEDLDKMYDLADILVSFRMSDSLNCRYVFPSKILSYLSWGKPVLSNDFDGLPDEYKRYINIVNEVSAKGISVTINQMLSNPVDVNARALSGKIFIEREKVWKNYSEVMYRIIHKAVK